MNHFHLQIENQKGSAAIEATFAILFFSILIGAGFLALYLPYARTWIHRSSYEAMICSSTKSSLSLCRKQLKMRLKTGLPFGKIQGLSLKKTNSSSDIRASFTLFDATVLEIEDHLDLPLMTRDERNPSLFSFF